MAKKNGNTSTTSDLERDPPSPDIRNREGQQSILGLIASLHLSSEYSDLAIICENKIFSAHKLVVCPRSEYFRKACYGGSKETKEPIRLDNKSSILLEKVLEFLYTGDYTFGNPGLASDSRQADGDERSDVDAEGAREPPISFQSDEGANENFTPETGETMTGIDLPASEINPVKLADTFLNSEKTALIHQPPEKDLSNLRGVGEPIADTLVDCHPCYFHMRMYGEADYFMIDDLKNKAREQFCASFVHFSDKKQFTEIIDELYSLRANYWELRKLAIKMIVGDLPNLRKAFPPIIGSRLIKAFPDFAIDLCLATMDEYVPFPSMSEHKKVDFMFHPIRSSW